MRINVFQDHSDATFMAKLDDDDRPEFGKASLADDTLVVELFNGYQLEKVHNDLIALAALVSFSPWIGKRLELPFPVSPGFAAASKQWLKIDLPNISGTVRPRIPADGARPGLSFSAGVDSLACLEIMPENTVPIFSFRSEKPGTQATLYNAESPLRAIEEMNAAGRETHKVRSNLEWLRQPVGFGVDPAPAMPLILLADWFNLDAIGFGTIAEAAYRTGTEHFIDYAERPIFKKWQGVFRAAGLEYYNCVAPMSELCTTKITRESKFGHLAQSCVRGLPGEPCMNCVKCFRKSLIEASMSGQWPEPGEVSRMMANRAIKNYLAASPIKLEIVLIAALSKYNGTDPLLLALQERIGAKEIDTSFTGGWYGPGIDAMVPEKYRDAVKEAASKYVPQMTPEQERAFETWDIRPKIQEQQEAGRIERFQAVLDENQRNYALATR